MRNAIQTEALLRQMDGYSGTLDAEEWREERISERLIAPHSPRLPSGEFLYNLQEWKRFHHADMLRRYEEAGKRALAILSKSLSTSIKANLTKMRYSEFLASDYWAMLRVILIFINGERCARCARVANLNINHRKYDHRGQEYDHPWDVEAICRLCHAKYHGKLRHTSQLDTKAVLTGNV